MHGAAYMAALLWREGCAAAVHLPDGLRRGYSWVRAPYRRRYAWWEAAEAARKTALLGIGVLGRRHGGGGSGAGAGPGAGAGAGGGAGAQAAAWAAAGGPSDGSALGGAAYAGAQVSAAEAAINAQLLLAEGLTVGGLRRRARHAAIATAVDPVVHWLARSPPQQNAARPTAH
jgi:hypothetical protein